MGVGAMKVVWAVVLCLISQCWAGLPVQQSDRQAGNPLQMQLQPVAAAADDVTWTEPHIKASGVHMADVQSSRPAFVARARSTSHSAWTTLSNSLQSAQAAPSLGGKTHQDSSPSTQPWHGPMLSRKLLAQQHAAQHMHMQQQEGSRPYNHAYGVLGSVAGLPMLAVVLMLMMTGRLSWLKRSKQSSTAGQPSADSFTDTSCMVDTNGTAERSARSVDAAVNLGADIEAAAAGATAGPAGVKAQEAQPRLLLAACHGWTLSDDCTTPQVGSIGGQAVRFGPELATGGVGRVFRATWSGSEVAVRALHTPSTAADISEQQLQQLVSLRHPNVLRTHCCVTFTPQGTPREVCGAAGAAAAADASTLVGHAQQLTLQDDAPEARDIGSSSSTRRDQGQQQQQHTTTASDGGAEIWLVQEYCDLGSLSTVALKWQGAGDADQHMLERLSLLSDTARGLREVHGLGLAHGDMNANSVLVSSSACSPDGMVAKVADLGPCAAAKQRLRSSGNVSSIRALSHVAPEVLRKSDAGPLGLEADIYAFGIMMWELYTGQQAYRKLRDAAHLYEAIVIQNLRPKIPEGMPADYQLLMERCWASDPADRPPADKLLGCLSVMAAERSRRLNPGAPPSPSATPEAAAAVAAAAAASPRAIGALRSPGGSRLSFQQQGGGAYAGDPTPWRNSIGGYGVASRAASITRPSYPGPLAPTPSQSGPLPGLQPSLQHQKSCPALAFEAFLRSNSRLPRDPEDEDDSEEGRDRGCDPTDSDVVGVGLDASLADDAVFAELWAEEDMLQQMRASSQTQSGPGSAPVLHNSQPHKRYADGLDDLDSMGRLDDNHMWHI